MSIAKNYSRASQRFCMTGSISLKRLIQNNSGLPQGPAGASGAS
jgi:hypothetical protein